MAAKKKEKLADFVEVYLPDSDTPVRVTKEMYDDPEEWKDAVRRAQSKRDEAVEEGMPDPSKSKDYKPDEAETAHNATEEAAEAPHVTAEVSPAHDMTDEEVARENDPNFDPSQFNMDGSRKTSEEQATFAKAGADNTVTSTSPDEPESAPSATTPEDADSVTTKTPSSRDWLSPEGIKAMGSDEYLASAEKNKLVTPHEAELLKQLNPEARADFLIKRSDMRDKNPVAESDIPPAGGQPTLGNYLTAAKDVMMEAAPAPWLAKQAGGLFPQALPPAGGPAPAATSPAPGQVPVPGTPVPGTPVPPVPPSAGGSVSGRTKTASPGMAPPAPSDGVMQTLADAEALRNGAATMAADAHAKKADIDRQALINQKALQEQAFKDQQHIAEQRAAAEAAYSKSLSDGQAAMSSLMTERRQLLNQRVDPDRYWNEAGAGRRVSAVLAGALYGWAGQGMDYLQHLRGLVNDDIKLQQDELRRKGDNIDALVGDQRNLIALAKQKGMTDLEAVEAAKAARYEELSAQLQMLATDSGIKNVNPALAQTLAGLANERATALDNAAKFRQQKAHEDAQVRLGYAKLAQERREMAFKMAKEGAGGPKTQEQKPQQQERLADYLKGAEGIASMWQDYKRLGGADSRMFPGSKGLSAMNPAGQLGLTDAGLWDGDKATEYTQLIGKPIEGGVVREEDTKRYRKNYIPSSTDTEERAKEKTDTLINQFVKNYAIELRTQAAAGIDVSQYEPPAALERRIREQTFPSRNQKPLPGETVRK